MVYIMSLKHVSGNFRNTPRKMANNLDLVRLLFEEKSLSGLKAKL